MSAAEANPRIEALRRHLGQRRFFRFIATLPVGSGRLLFWQARALDLLEEARGIALPREPAALSELLAGLLPSHPTLPAESLPRWIVIDELGGNAPVQATGRVAQPAARFYFRARHEHWSIRVTTEAEGDPAVSDIGFYCEEEFGYARGDASHMPLDVARFFIVRELTKWRDAKLSMDG